MTTTELNGYIILDKYIDEQTKKDIDDLLDIAKPPEEFCYEADIKYMYYKEGRLVGIIAYNIALVGQRETPVFIHVILHPDFQRTKEAYKFLFDNFRNIKQKYNLIIAHIPNDREQMINFALKVGFVMYNEEENSKFYYLDLEKIR